MGIAFGHGFPAGVQTRQGFTAEGLNTDVYEARGETPLALVVKRTGATVTAEELKQWGNAKLAKYQRLGAVEFRDSLPRSPIGKVLKRVLREPYWKDEK